MTALHLEFFLRQLSGKHALVLRMLIKIACRCGEVFPSVETIARETGASLSTVHRGLNTLEALGWIIREKRRCRRGNWHHNVYRFAGEALDYIKQHAGRKIAAATRTAKALLAAELRKYQQLWHAKKRAKSATHVKLTDDLSFSVPEKRKLPPTPPKSRFLQQFEAGEIAADLELFWKPRHKEAPA